MENSPEVYIRPSKRLKQSLEEMIQMLNHLTLQEPAQAASQAALRPPRVTNARRVLFSGDPGRFPPESHSVMNF